VEISVGHANNIKAKTTRRFLLLRSLRRTSLASQEDGSRHRFGTK